MDLVDCGVDVGSVGRVPSCLLGEVGDYHADPAEDHQEDGNVDVVDEETSLACPLETPVHRISAE